MSKEITQQSTNKINIVGKLLDTTFGEGKLNDGRKYERASMTVRVTQTYNDQTETSEVPVGIFATQYTSTGKVNPAWDNLQRLKGMKTAQNVGIEEADTIRISGANIRENNFVSKTGQLITGWQIGTSFISAGTSNDIASFNVDIFIMDIHDEEDRNGETTGRLIVKGGVVQYGGKLDVLEFVVETPTKVEFVSRNWEINKLVNARGYIRVTSEETPLSASHSSWGEEIPDISTRMVRELVITTGSDEPVDEEFAYSLDDIRKAFAVRKANIEQMQIQAKNTGTKQPAPAEATSNKYSWE